MTQLNKRHEGFTMIEMALAMVFVALLLLAIATTSIRMSHMYVRGVTLAAVNEAGQAVMKDIKRSITDSSMQNFDVTNHFNSGSSTSAGRLCLGTYSYVWNNGSAFDTGSLQKYTGAGATAFRLVKVSDTSKSQCSGAPNLQKSTSTELLPDASRNLAVQKLSIEPLSSDVASHQSLYRVTMVLGTNERSALNTTDLSCRPPNDDQNNFEYCAVNTFSMIVRAGNGG